MKTIIVLLVSTLLFRTIHAQTSTLPNPKMQDNLPELQSECRSATATSVSVERDQSALSLVAEMETAMHFVPEMHSVGYQEEINVRGTGSPQSSNGGSKNLIEMDHRLVELHSQDDGTVTAVDFPEGSQPANANVGHKPLTHRKVNIEAARLLPLFASWTAYSDPSIGVTHLPPEQTDEGVVNVVRITTHAGMNGGDGLHAPRNLIVTDLLISPSDLILRGSRTTVTSCSGIPARDLVDDRYVAYSTVSGMVLPTTIRRSINFHPAITITLSNFAINPTIPSPHD